MQGWLITYANEEVYQIDEVALPENYDGDCYGDTCPFVVGSNQQVVTTNPIWAYDRLPTIHLAQNTKETT